MPVGTFSPTMSASDMPSKNLMSARRRRDVVAAAPDEHLLLAELGRRLGLVEALQRAVVPLVQAPVLLDRQPQPVHLFQREVERADGALQQGGEAEVEV